MTDTAIINRALELVRDGLRSGAIPAHNFNMRQWATKRFDAHCGTVACIGGWTELLISKARGQEVNIAGFAMLKDMRLRALFMLDRSPHFIPHKTPTQAADAIDRHLNGQKPWGQS